MNKPEEAGIASIGDRDLANALRILTIDAIEAAKSGHPGLPMGMADVATVLYARHLEFDPKTPDWADRDRFVLSAGHGSMLLYGLLHLTGYADLPIDQLKRFRQLGSFAAGHPEHGHGRGVETTTGPLGQGFANAVGMAIAERHLAARYGRDLVDHRIYVIASDGDLMEGVSHEAASLAGHLGLSKLIVLYDDNQISIDGPTDLSLSDDALKRFDAYGWAVSRIDGHDHAAIDASLRAAREETKPSLVACRTLIGFGSPKKQGTSSIHANPLGAQEIAATRAQLGWSAPPFEIPAAILDRWRAIGAKGGAGVKAWRQRLAASPMAEDFTRAMNGVLPEALESAMAALRQKLVEERPTIATRKASNMAIAAVSAAAPEILGGSADLTESNLTKAGHGPVLSRSDYAPNYVHYGVREHAMAAAMNGMALHGGIVPFGGTFLVFSDYARPAIRLAALMGLRVIYVMTHDSIGVGEDGPTHQPVEHLAALRAIPNLAVFRPADAIETAECWEAALKRREGPSLLALTRQNVPALRESAGVNLSMRGAYVISESSSRPKVVVIATGSEVQLALSAAKELEAAKIPTRVVSMPAMQIFEAQPPEYRKTLLPEDAIKIGIEAGVSFGWAAHLGQKGYFIGMNGFGASAPFNVLFEHFGITAAAIVAAAKTALGNGDKA